MWAYLALLAVAAVQDAVSLRIANLITVSILAVAGIALAVSAPADWWQHLVSFAAVLLVGLLLFSRSWMGGGDVKLMAASALAFDLRGLLLFFVITTFAGGLLAMLFVGPKLLRGHSPGAKRRNLPYGVAIALGAALTLLIYPANTTLMG